MYARKILFNKVKFDVRTGLLYVQVESCEMILFLFVRCGTFNVCIDCFSVLGYASSSTVFSPFSQNVNSVFLSVEPEL